MYVCTYVCALCMCIMSVCMYVCMCFKSVKNADVMYAGFMHRNTFHFIIIFVGIICQDMVPKEHNIIVTCHYIFNFLGDGVCKRES